RPRVDENAPSTPVRIIVAPVRIAAERIVEVERVATVFPVDPVGADPLRTDSSAETARATGHLETSLGNIGVVPPNENILITHYRLGVLDDAPVFAVGGNNRHKSTPGSLGFEPESLVAMRRIGFVYVLDPSNCAQNEFVGHIVQRIGAIIRE